MVQNFFRLALVEESRVHTALEAFQRTRSRLNQNFEKYKLEHELAIAYKVVFDINQKSPLQIKMSELDSGFHLTSSEVRLENIGLYLHRLPLNEKCVLILKEILKLPDEKIAAILKIPIESTRFIEKQALDMLERWIWE